MFINNSFTSFENANKQEIYIFNFDMNFLFQEYMYCLIEEYMYCLIEENKKVKYIIDIKYKILGNVDVNAKVSREDFFQMNVYIDKYDSKKAILLYPQEINKYRNKYSFVKDGENKILVCTVN